MVLYNISQVKSNEYNEKEVYVGILEKSKGPTGLISRNPYKTNDEVNREKNI